MKKAFPVVYMDVKLELFARRKDVDWRGLRTGRWIKYLDMRARQ